MTQSSEKKFKRICIGCNQAFNRTSLLKFICTNGHLVYDKKETIPGRSFYIAASKECIEKAKKRSKILKNKEYQQLLTKLAEELTVPSCTGGTR